ncbi:hypothetical protein VE04_09484 [Pseudogymnoascus sp. 24MN13]|nr:hypothetical protein VE04_09484 [Pseudogymnoascus sp. 24MN13]
MKLSTALLISASAALTSATGPDYDPATNKWTGRVPDVVYCAGDSLKTNIIIRCTGLVGQPGNCNDNLAGQPPLSVQPTLCYAPELHKAACAKNCIVYGGSGNLDGTFPLPEDVCTPTPEPTATTVTDTAEPTTTDEPTATTVTHTREPTTTTDEPTATTITDTAEPTTTTEEPTATTITHTAEPTGPTDEATVTVTIYTCDNIPVTTITTCETTPLPPSTVVTHTNGTSIVHPTGGVTNTPVGPTSTNIPPIPNAGGANSASLGMVVLVAAVAFMQTLNFQPPGIIITSAPEEPFIRSAAPSPSSSRFDAEERSRRSAPPSPEERSLTTPSPSPSLTGVAGPSQGGRSRSSSILGAGVPPPISGAGNGYSAAGVSGSMPPPPAPDIDIRPPRLHALSSVPENKIFLAPCRIRRAPPTAARTAGNPAVLLLRGQTHRGPGIDRGLGTQ